MAVAQDLLSRAFRPGKLGNLELKNRFLKAATFEGKTPAGLPTPEYLRFHQEILKGGAAMTTLAYLACEADGRISSHMMHVREDLRAPLEKGIATLKEEGGRVSGQLVHCGGFSRNKNLERLKRPLGPSARLNLAGLTEGLPFVGAMDEREMDRLTQSYAAAARFMKEVGFDALELHFGHGYLLGQFISPKTNRRRDRWGGSLENRMGFPLQVYNAVRAEVGSRFPILGKLSLTEGVRGGLELEEALKAGHLLSDAGVDALVASGGSSSFNPMEMFRGESFLKGLIAEERNPLTRLGMRLVGPTLFAPRPYQELYFREAALKLKERVSCKVIYIGGCSTAESVAELMGAGFEFVQLGRALIRDPGWVKALETGDLRDTGCTHCNKCVPLIDAPGGIRCVEREREEGHAKS